MTRMPAASVYGSHDVIEVQPMPDPGRVYAYAVDDPIEHTVSEITDLVFISIMPAFSDRHVLLYGGPADTAHPDYAIPLTAASTPFAVTRGAIFTLLPDGEEGDVQVRIQEATV